MDNLYSLQAEVPDNKSNVTESFRFVSEEKRDVWRDSQRELSEPSCGLSVSKISYTVR